MIAMRRTRFLKFSSRSLLAAAVMAGLSALAFSTAPASAGNELILRHIAGDMGSGSLHRKGGGKNHGMREVQGMREMKAGGKLQGHQGGKRKIATHTGGRKRGGMQEVSVSNTNVNRNNITIENNINLDNSARAAARSGVRYVASGHSIRYGKRGHSYKHSGNSHVSRRPVTNIVRQRMTNNSTVVSNRGGGGFSNSGMIVLSINNNNSFNNNTGMEPVAGSLGGLSSADCAYGTYCTINLGGPKIITFNDVGDIADGEIVHDGIPEDDLIYAK